MSMSNDRIRKAAILLSTLDPAEVDRMLDQMPQDMAIAVRRAILDLRQVDDNEEQAVIDEFLRGAASGVESPTNQHEESPFAFLDLVSTDSLLTLLCGERAPTIALVLAHLDKVRASEVLASLPLDLQDEVTRRLRTIDAANRDVSREVARVMEDRYRERLRQPDNGPYESDDIGSDDAEWRTDRSAARGTNRCDLEALNRFNDRELAELLAEFDASLLPLALAMAEQRLLQRVWAVLPSRQSKQLRRAMTHLGPTRIADLHAAASSLSQLAREHDARRHAEVSLSLSSIAAFD